MNYHDLVMAVRELVERHWDVYTMASRLKVDPVIIQQIIKEYPDKTYLILNIQLLVKVEKLEIFLK